MSNEKQKIEQAKKYCNVSQSAILLLKDMNLFNNGHMFEFMKKFNITERDIFRGLEYIFNLIDEKEKQLKGDKNGI